MIFVIRHGSFRLEKQEIQKGFSCLVFRYFNKTLFLLFFQKFIAKNYSDIDLNRNLSEFTHLNSKVNRYKKPCLNSDSDQFLVSSQNTKKLREHFLADIFVFSTVQSN